MLAQLRVAALMSDEHFSVDGTLIETWASHKSFQPEDTSDPGNDRDDPPAGRNPERNFRGEKRCNETHASTADPDARLARKSNNTAAILAYSGRALMGEAADHRRTRLCAAVTDRRGAAVRDVLAALRARIDHRRLEPAIRGLDLGAGFGAAHRRAA